MNILNITVQLRGEFWHAKADESDYEGIGMTQAHAINNLVAGFVDRLKEGAATAIEKINASDAAAWQTNFRPHNVHTFTLEI